VTSARGAEGAASTGASATSERAGSNPTQEQLDGFREPLGACSRTHGKRRECAQLLTATPTLTGLVQGTLGELALFEIEAPSFL